MKNTRVFLKAPHGQHEAYKQLAIELKNYLQVHPIPDGMDFVVELVPVPRKKLPFDYAWSGGSRTDAQAAWQGVLDVWLKNRFGAEISQGERSIVVRVVKDAEMSSDRKPTGLIEGEGLATFTTVEPKFRMRDLIVPDVVRAQISQTIGVLANRELIYETWGFAEVDPCPRAVLNFYGPPGTGKTMAAHCIADALKKKILIANFAEIESKYVGDSPKNLENIFHIAKAEDAVLFFDEADSFLGKRLTSISSSSDQAVNSLRSKLLQLLEDHTGIVVFCTNLLRNYDKAFESRMLGSIKFDLPDDACRRALIRQKIPMKVPFAVPLDDEMIGRLSALTEGFSGREIKNAVLKVLCSVASRGGRTFTVADFEDGFSLAKAEIEQLRTESGRLSKAKSEAIGEKVREKLASGDFAVQKNREVQADV